MDKTLKKMMMMMTTMQRLESVGERVLGDRVAGRLLGATNCVMYVSVDTYHM